jgi:hypothetical protein
MTMTANPQQRQPDGTDHRRALIRLRRAALGDASDRELVQLARHLRWCNACREVYDRQVGIDHELARLGGAESVRLVPLERALARAAILQASAEPRGLLRTLRARWWVGVCAAAVVALLLLLLPLLSHLGGPPAPEFGTRGEGPVALRLFCVSPGAPAAEQFRPASNDGGAAASCRLQESLKFSYLNAARPRYLWVLGLDEQIEIKWYYPVPGARGGVPIKTTRELVPLPDMIRLQVNHRPGMVRVFAIFSAEKIRAAQIERAVGQLRQQRLPLHKIDAIPLGASTQQIVQELRLLP